MVKRIPGTKDILPEEAFCWQRIEDTARRIFWLYNYQEIRTPLLEDESLFNRCLGESAEIVQKQMFLVKKEGKVYALRPEGTASIVRAYIENSLDKTAGFMKLYYIGPMFRLERPQKGRLRQFHHIGCEAIGSQDAALDCEIISLTGALLEGFAVTGYKIKINSLGCADDKKQLNLFLRDGLKNKVNRLCDDCQYRFRRNVLRILDCKNENCQKIIHELDIEDSHLCADCRDHFKQVTDNLSSLGIDYALYRYLVRGLDYYTRTVFEVKHSQLGAQDALGAGGRYDNLVKELGGPGLGAIGFAFGIERLILVSNLEAEKARTGKMVYIISLGDQARGYAVRLLNKLRSLGIACDTDYENRSLKGAMRLANDFGAKYAVLIGEDELKKKTVTLKDMVQGSQQEISQENLIPKLKESLT